MLIPLQGSWGGKGLKKRKLDSRFLITKPGIEASTRKDFTRSNVIISEKKDKRAHQFLVKDLPYPYTSVAQYERSFDMPLGSEWNSRGVHQRETTPRVIKKVRINDSQGFKRADDWGFSRAQSLNPFADSSDAHTPMSYAICMYSGGRFMLSNSYSPCIPRFEPNKKHLLLSMLPLACLPGLRLLSQSIMSVYILRSSSSYSMNQAKTRPVQLAQLSDYVVCDDHMLYGGLE